MNLSRTYVGAFLVAIAGIIFWILLMPTYDNVMAQREAIAQRTDIIKTKSDIIANINALTKEYADRSVDIARFALMVPAAKSAPELVSSIEALATQNGLQLKTISLSGNINQDTNPYQEQSISLELSGGYLAFKSFLMALERNIRLIDVSSIDASPTSDNSPIISFRIKGNAYYLKQ
ncbi:MAG: type 4a pilus biogenesis protein PilO [Patescibacteria group bacterium]